MRAEPGIELFLNTDVTEVEADGPEDARVIRSVTGWMSGSERRITVTGASVIDCSGDGLVGHLAGAEVMRGSEPREQFEESWAPEVPDENMLGSTILFYSKDVGRRRSSSPRRSRSTSRPTAIPQNRVIRQDDEAAATSGGSSGAASLDVVHDNERIRDELQAVCYGLWDHIKNSGEFDADKLTLEWVGAVPGKREYRRFVGDHVLTQHDVLGQTEFEDRIGYGGWSIDLHPVGGVYATEKGSRHWHPDGNYHIPLRSLFSKNVTNLWMAGRNICASHVAFGTTRVMATCAVLGEAAGIGAAVAAARGEPPRRSPPSMCPICTGRWCGPTPRVLGRRRRRSCGPGARRRGERLLLRRRCSARRGASGRCHRWIRPGPRAAGGPACWAWSRSWSTPTEGTELHVELHSVGRPQNYLPAPACRSQSWPRSLRGAPGCMPVWIGSRTTAQNAFVVLRAERAARGPSGPIGSSPAPSR